MMENSFETFLLYYFSAIAQVVAAVIALGGVFLVFYMQSLNKSILNSAKKLFHNLNVFITKFRLNDEFKIKDLRIISERFKGAIISKDINDIYRIFNYYKLQDAVSEILEIDKKNPSNSEVMIDLLFSTGDLADFIDSRKYSLYYFKRSFFFGSVVILLSLSFIIFSYFKILPLNILAILITFSFTILVLINIYKIIKTSFN